MFKVLGLVDFGILCSYNKNMHAFMLIKMAKYVYKLQKYAQIFL